MNIHEHRNLKCDNCDKRITWGFVDYSDTPGWVHTETDEALCDPGNDDSTQAEPQSSTYEHISQYYITI